jgi:hypothetical protein
MSLNVPLLTMVIIGSQEHKQNYGYLSYQQHVVLGLNEVDCLVHTVTEELDTTHGFTTLFLFSSLALNVKLLQCSLPHPKLPLHLGIVPCTRRRRDLAQRGLLCHFPELLMHLCWGLARVLRVSAGNAICSLISWGMYIKWCEAKVSKRFTAVCLEQPSMFINSHSLL